MSSRATTATPRVGPATERTYDFRRFWRIALAIVAPLPMTAMGILYLVDPYQGNGGYAATVANYADRPTLMAVGPWLGLVFCTGLVPAAFAVAWAVRRRVPRLGMVGGLIAVGGLLGGVSLLNGPMNVAALTAQHGLDVEVTGRLQTALDETPVFMVGGLLFISGIVFGLLLLGIALAKSGLAPAWMGIALAIGGFTHPFMPNHIAAGIGLLVAAVGFAGGSVALLRTADDDFDLPPMLAPAGKASS